MSEYVYAKAITENSESKLLKYSIIDYCYNQFKNPNLSSDYSNVLHSMLEFGGYCQIYFNVEGTPYNQNRLASDDYHLVTLNNCVFSDNTNHGYFSTNEKITLSNSYDDTNTYLVESNNNYYFVKNQNNLEINNLSNDIVITYYEGTDVAIINFSGPDYVLYDNGIKTLNNCLFIPMGETITFYDDYITYLDHKITFTFSSCEVLDNFSESGEVKITANKTISFTTHYDFTILKQELDRQLENDKDNMFGADYNAIKQEIDSFIADTESMDYDSAKGAFVQISAKIQEANVTRARFLAEFNAILNELKEEFIDPMRSKSNATYVEYLNVYNSRCETILAQTTKNDANDYIGILRSETSSKYATALNRFSITQSEAKEEINTLAEEIKEKIDRSTLTDETKSEARMKVDICVNSAKYEIDDAFSEDEVSKSLVDFEAKLYTIQSNYLMD